MTPPERIDGANVVAYAGRVVARYESGHGYYLFYCDENWNAVTDTHHETVEDAERQAEFEYERVVWMPVESPFP